MGTKDSKRTAVNTTVQQEGSGKSVKILKRFARGKINLVN
jgi:hypothetical protein